MSIGESGLLDNLVTQFSSALDCFRELVQNSIDAGTPAVEVWLEFERGEGHMGVISVHVDDFGEGMDEAIIDNQLTCLFSSTKENDLTKIGKFGIGFVSVFALQPKGVLVTTGRGGQYWEIFFHEDRSFTKSPLDMPTEGTQITIFKEGNYRQYCDMVEGIRAILKRWCAHSETEITFEDRSPPDDVWREPEVLNEVFEVPGLCLVESEYQGTHIVMAYSDEPLYGFYNRGLTLALETIGENVLDHRARRYAHIAFKIKSRYLEHTLSRETVMRDENYEKAMKLVDETANQKLFAQLIIQIQEILARPNWSHEDITQYAKLMTYFNRESIGQIVAAAEQPIFRLISGQTASLSQLFGYLQEYEELLFSDHQSSITDALAEQGIPVVFGHHARGGEQPWQIVGDVFSRYAAYRFSESARGKVKRFVSWFMESKPRFDIEVAQALGQPEDRYMPVRVDAKPPPEAEGLVRAAASLLKANQSRYKRLSTCHLVSHHVHSPLFVVAPKLSTVMREPLNSELIRAKSLEAAVNLDHPHAQTLIKLYARAPEIAAYCLAKGLLLEQDQMLDLDMKLIESAQQLSV